MPKQRITKENILEAAFQLVRSKGFESVNARNVAKEAACSVQPIYSCYQNMEQLMEDLFEYSRQYQLQYVRERLVEDNYFESTGRSHISFAKEEPNLFKFLFLSKYIKCITVEDIYKQYGLEEVTSSIEDCLGIGEDQARQLYLDMMIYTHGIASMIASGAMELSDEEVHENSSRVVCAFLAQLKEGSK